ncbi:pre-mRNA-splicing factor cwf23 [Humulus lupulus]|uniref:pre-mRNA-splicing factor cwf23 n=1 Tax=Humulus lupulus TaxID=3486 RepID=UPI002B40FCC0|nr:pre-mRNA-splicing factor cwf23 [Humulus lupulus]
MHNKTKPPFIFETPHLAFLLFFSLPFSPFLSLSPSLFGEMGKVGQESDFKTQLVAEICSISTGSNACVHRQHCSQANKLPFIDWYRIIGVEEDAGIDVIKKCYHKLALQLHPDKNKHPKAEIAFKLVSEAYSCLSDNAQRKAFDLRRWRSFCFDCLHANMANPNLAKNKARRTPSWPRSHKILRGLKDLRDRFREETKVIENCLKANAASATAGAAATTSRKDSSLFSPTSSLLRSKSHSGSRKESPIFNPSDYVFEGYPHMRSRVYKKPDNFWFMKTGHVFNSERDSRGNCDSPIFEIRPQRGIFKSKSTYVHS